MRKLLKLFKILDNQTTLMKSIKLTQLHHVLITIKSIKDSLTKFVPIKFTDASPQSATKKTLLP